MKLHNKRKLSETKQFEYLCVDIIEGKMRQTNMMENGDAPFLKRRFVVWVRELW